MRWGTNLAFAASLLFALTFSSILHSENLAYAGCSRVVNYAEKAMHVTARDAAVRCASLRRAHFPIVEVLAPR